MSDFYYDEKLNIHTHHFQFRCWRINRNLLPGDDPINFPEDLNISRNAHENASLVASFIKKILGRNGLDGKGKSYISSINCIDSRYPGRNSREWLNACWLPPDAYVLYGQKQADNEELISFASSISIVAHEFFHGITHYTAKLEAKRYQSGALNESYSDIFAILISNGSRKNISEWTWQIGEPLDQCGVPVRNLSKPSIHGHPEHMRDYNESRGVHYNNGIHNKAAYNIITATDNQGNNLFNVESLARLFYRSLLQLGPRSEFSDSRLRLLASAASEFRNDPVKSVKLRAIANAFDNVGIS